MEEGEIRFNQLLSHPGLENPGNRGFLSEIFDLVSNIMPGMKGIIKEPGEVDPTTPENKKTRIDILKYYFIWALTFDNSKSIKSEMLCALALNIGKKYGISENIFL
jgi:hypothetical protein